MKKWLSMEFFLNCKGRKDSMQRSQRTLINKISFAFFAPALSTLQLIVFVLSCFWSYSAYSQTDCEVNPPKAPLFTSVSVEFETGNTKFTWTLSPSPDIAAYVLYSYENGDGMPLPDTIWNPLATSYTYTSTVTKYKSASYVVAAMRKPRCTSIFSNVLNTIFAKAEIDTCNKKIVVKWNSYSSYPKKVTGYSILMSINGGNYTEAANVKSEVNSDTLNIISTAAKYCFVVRANLEDGTFSTSNKACASPGICKIPPVIIIDSTDIITDPEIITVPNVFTPNNDGVNDLFRPVLSFTPQDYHLVISDRRGTILFETKDYNEDWDGTKNGKPQPQGVCLWYLKLTTPKGKSISKTGTVTIINNRQ
jgi:gliding motility-associated-like protein